MSLRVLKTRELNHACKLLCTVTACSNKGEFLLLAKFNMGLMGLGRWHYHQKKAVFLWNICGLKLCVGVCYFVTPFCFQVSQKLWYGRNDHRINRLHSLPILIEQQP